MIRGILQKSSRYFIWMIIAKVASTAAFVLLGRSLGAQGFGEFLYLLAVIQLITVLTDMGTTHWQQRQQDALLSLQKAFLVRLVALCAVVPFLVGISYLLSVSSLLLLLLLIALCSELLLSVTDGYFLATDRGQYLSYKVLSKTFLTILLFLLLQSPVVASAVVAYILGNIGTIIWSFPWGIVRRPVSLHVIGETVRESSPYALLMVTSFAYARADSLIIGSIAGAGALGIYGAAYRYLEGVSMLPTALGQVLFPLHGRGALISTLQLKKLFAFSAFFGVIVWLGLFLAAPFLIQGIFGDAYASGAWVLRVLSFVAFLFFLNAPLATILQSSSKVRSFLPWGVANTFLNVLLNFVFVYQFGAIGAAYAMLCTEITGFFLNIFFIRSLYSAAKPQV